MQGAEDWQTRLQDEHHHHHHARLPQASDNDCDFGNTRALFTDLFGSTFRSPWLLCAVESATGKLDNTSVVVITDNKDEFSMNWPAQLPNPGQQISIPKCLDGTPLREWLDSPELANSHFRQQNIANAVRLAALYKSGGTYLDLDIIPLHKEIFDPAVGSISKQCEIEDCGKGFFLNNAFLSFPAKAPFVQKLMEAFVVEFNGNVWGWNGPRLVSELYMRLLCWTPAGVHDCHKMKVLAIERLAPFDWDEIMPVLSSQPDESYAQLVGNKDILGIHAYHNVSPYCYICFCMQVYTLLLCIHCFYAYTALAHTLLLLNTYCCTYVLQHTITLLATNLLCLCKLKCFSCAELCAGMAADLHSIQFCVSQNDDRSLPYGSDNTRKQDLLSAP